MYNPNNYLAQTANCFLLFCSNLAVFKFPTLLAISKTQLKFDKGSPPCREGYIQSPFYSLNYVVKPH